MFSRSGAVQVHLAEAFQRDNLRIRIALSLDYGGKQNRTDATRERRIMTNVGKIERDKETAKLRVSVKINIKLE